LQKASHCLHVFCRHRCSFLRVHFDCRPRGVDDVYLSLAIAVEKQSSGKRIRIRIRMKYRSHV
jgi:hypothetical protein